MSRLQTFGRAIASGIVGIAPLRETLRYLSTRGLLPAAVHHRLPVTGPFRLGLPGGKSILYEPTVADLVSRRLYWRGTFGFEPETTRVFWHLTRRASVFLDIGANTGYFTLLATIGNPDMRVFAFEPVPRIRERLNRQVENNKVADRVRVLDLAVADYIGKAKFHVPHEELPSSASLNTDGFRGFAGEIVEVEVSTVDAAIPADMHVDLVKLDVEGFEDKALLGMTRILRDNQPNLIVECLPDGPYAQVNEILNSFGYQPFHLLPEGPRRIDRVEPDVLNRYGNFLFLPSAQADIILQGVSGTRI
jgi:FkbM family methyltransferase